MIIRPNSRRRRRGVTLVESSVGLVILLFVIFGIIEFGQLIMARQLINNASRSAARAASSGGVVTSAFLNTWITKALIPAPLSNVNPQYYGSNANGSANTGIAWDSTAFGQGFYVDLRANYIPLFSGNRFFADSSGNKGPMTGSIGLRSLVYVRAEANN